MQPPASSSVPNADGWLLVHQCEATPWTQNGPNYFGGLGFTAQTWDSYGGQQFAPTAGEATPEQQMTVANRIESPPFSDTPQGGCHGW